MPKIVRIVPVGNGIGCILDMPLTAEGSLTIRDADEEARVHVEAMALLDAQDRIKELESICHSQQATLGALAKAAGYHLGEAYTAPALIARLRDGDR